MLSESFPKKKIIELTKFHLATFQCHFRFYKDLFLPSLIIWRHKTNLKYWHHWWSGYFHWVVRCSIRQHLYPFLFFFWHARIIILLFLHTTTWKYASDFCFSESSSTDRTQGISVSYQCKNTSALISFKVRLG